MEMSSGLAKVLFTGVTQQFQIRLFPGHTDSTERGHGRHRRDKSPMGTAGPTASAMSRRVTSWKPRSTTLVSRINTRTLSWALPGRTRTVSASAYRVLNPRTSGTHVVSQTTTHVVSNVTTDSGAFYGDLHMNSEVDSIPVSPATTSAQPLSSGSRLHLP